MFVSQYLSICKMLDDDNCSDIRVLENNAQVTNVYIGYMMLFGPIFVLVCLSNYVPEKIEIVSNNTNIIQISHHNGI